MLPDASRLTLHASHVLLILAFVVRIAHAQVRGKPVHQDTGPLSEMSTNVGAGSGPVHQWGRSVSDGSLGTLGGNAVRDSASGDVRSGPVSDISVGAVTSGRPVSGSGTVTDASAGAVKKDVDSPLGERISQPVRDLGPLLEQLHAVQPVLPDASAAAGAEDAAWEVQPGEEEAGWEAQEPTRDEEQAASEEPAAVEPDAPASDVAAVEAEPAPGGEAESPPPDQDNAAPPSVADDRRDAAETSPTPSAD
jgi:hypothetical protein